MTWSSAGSVRFGLYSGQKITGWIGYFLGYSGHRMKVEFFDEIYRGGAAQEWQRLCG
jgi:hypothetical protein